MMDGLPSTVTSLLLMDGVPSWSVAEWVPNVYMDGVLILNHFFIVDG